MCILSSLKQNQLLTAVIQENKGKEHWCVKLEFENDFFFLLNGLDVELENLIFMVEMFNLKIYVIYILNICNLYFKYTCV